MKKISSLFLSLLFLGTVFGYGQKSSTFVTRDGAIRGYDPVAYFKEGKPVQGDSLNAYTWNGASWHFANAENMQAFTKDPEKYAPQFGGYCAYGLYAGHKAPTDPQAWAIVDGKLYLNYSKAVQTKWKENQPACIEEANKKWPLLKDKE